MNISDEIERLNQLRMQGVLTEEEFQQAKAQTIGGTSQISDHFSNVDENLVFGMETNTWCMLMHLSQLAYVAGGAGCVIPILMWAISKDKNPEADRHGAAIINWQITLFIALLVFGALSFIVVGIPFVIIAAILGVVFPVVAAMKANNGEFWTYPMSIRFIEDAEEMWQEEQTTYL